MGYLTFDDGLVTLDGATLNALFQGINIKTSVRFDEAKVDGSSGKKKTPQGFEDSEISINMILLTDEISDCYEKLEEINAIFKGIDKNANPKIYTITNRHLLARGVREVVFASLDSVETNNSDEISIALRFIEHNPPIIKMEETKAKQPTAKELAEVSEQEEEMSDDDYVFTVEDN